MTTHPAMTDERLDRLVLHLLADRAEDVAAAAATPDTMAERITTRLRPSPVGRAWMLVAAALLAALLIAGGLVAGGVLRFPGCPPQNPFDRNGPVRAPRLKRDASDRRQFPMERWLGHLGRMDRHPSGSFRRRRRPYALDPEACRVPSSGIDPGSRRRVVEYGVVLDVSGDGVADFSYWDQHRCA